MKAFFQTLALLLLPAFCMASNTIAQIKAADPDAYADAQASCTQWAEDDQTPPEDMKRYVDECIIDMLGYLAEDTDYPDPDGGE